MRRPAGAPRAQNFIGVVLIALVLLTLGGFAAAAILLRPPPVDAETLCRSDQPIHAHTIILVDATDRLERRHKRKLEALATQERARLSQYDRLTLMRLDPRHPQEPRVLFSKCLPRPPNMTNPLFENARFAQREWDETFADALDRALRSAGSSGPAHASPILAGLRAIAADPDFGAEIPQRRLVVVSDLMEHDPDGFSLYARAVDYSRWNTGDPNGPADLSDIDLRIAMLDRPDIAERQADARDHFWAFYFDQSGAKSVRFDPSP